jgi:adenine-specific DNA-methyltransferase
VSAREIAVGAIEKDFETNDLDYGRKLYLIENCIYGVDIQPIAIQISKLRFFVSLICDQRTNKNKAQNCGVRPLPNLETKFVAANTLISLDRGQDQLLLTNPRLAILEVELAAVRHRHFAAQRRRDKLALQRRDAEIRKEIAVVLAGSMSVEASHQLAAWDPYDQNTFAPFFDVEWMYGIMDGFNVVIGNPPYVQIQKFSGKQEQKDWEKQRFASFVKTGDVYCLFYEKGNMLLRDNGVLAFITSNKWMRANYGKATRKYFLGQVNIQQLIDFGDSQLFENATTYTNILIFSKEKDRNQSQVWDLSKVYEAHTSLETMLAGNKGCISLFSEDSFVIVPMEQAIVKKRIEAMGTPLKNWDVSINYGIKTGFNEAFIVDGAKKDELIAADPKNAEIIKPILRGRDIKRYKVEFSDLWLINTHNGYQGVPPIRVDDYPAIKVHLDHYWNKLKKRQDKGVTSYNLRNCAYLSEFEKKKIVWPETSLANFLCLDKKGFFLDKTCFFMVPNSKYLLALLNSRVTQFYLSLLVSKMRGGYFSMSKIYVEKVPIKKLSLSKQLPFEILVDCIFFAKEHHMESESSTLESVIDGMVYDLYFEDEMKKANCYITDRITEVIKPFNDDDTDNFKKQYIEKLVKFCNEDKTVYRGLIYRRTVKVVKIVTGAKK